MKASAAAALFSSHRSSATVHLLLLFSSSSLHVQLELCSRGLIVFSRFHLSSGGGDGKGDNRASAEEMVGEKKEKRRRKM